MTETTEIRRHANGSIDIAHYAQIGRALHGKAVRDAARSAVTAPDRLFARLVAALLRRLRGGVAADTERRVAPAE